VGAIEKIAEWIEGRAREANIEIWEGDDWDWPGWFLSLESSFPAPGGSWQTRAEEPANRTPPEIVEKVLHLRRTYHLGPIRIVWYLARYHDIKISDAEFTLISLWAASCPWRLHR
jgi:hypothetical protein